MTRVSATVSGQPQITASVGENVIRVGVNGGSAIDVSVGGGVGPAGESTTITVSAPLTNAGTAASPQLGVSVGAGLSVSGGSLMLASHTHTASQITDFTAAVVAAAPPTTDASLLTSGTLPDARLSANIARTSDVTSAVSALVDSAPGALDTLNELAAALGDDANFATTVTNALAGKAAASHAHAAGDIVSGTLDSARLPTSGVSTGTYTSVTVDAYGRVTAGGTHAVSWDDISSKPSFFDGAYSSLTGIPSTFAPSSHNHAASEITSGTLDIARIPTGASSDTVCIGNDSRLSDDRMPVAHTHGNITNSGAIGTTSGLPIITTTSGVLTTGAFGSSAGQFAAGDHTHSQLHDRSHAITSTSDHTATAWRSFYSNGSGVIAELALGAAGTVLTSGGESASPSFSALPDSGTKSFAKFTPSDNNPPASNYATLDTRNSVLVLEFDASTDESAVFVGYVPEGATLTSGLKVRISWMADTATSGSVRWGVQFEADGTDLDSDSFDTATLATSAASATSGIETVAEITATAIDSLAAGDRFRLKVYRDADDATNDTMTGDAQLVAVEVQAA